MARERTTVSPAEGRGGRSAARRARSLACLLISLLGCQATAPADSALAGEVRPPVAAGSFYPADGERLRAAVDAVLADAVAARAGRPIAVIAPHAGYVFSGGIAADAFQQAADQRYDTIVVLGTNHTVPGFRGAAVAPQAGFRTPLGIVETDRAVVDLLLKECRSCRLDAAPHAREHSVEVQLPFIQRLWPAARIVALVIGDSDLELGRDVGGALARVLAGRSALIVASSDLSHYPTAAQAERLDGETLSAIAALDPARIRAVLHGSAAAAVDTAACGEAAILTAVTAAKGLGARRGVFVSYAHSGQTPTGDPERVVGYGAVALTSAEVPALAPALLRAPGKGEASDALTGADRRTLLRLARETLRRLLTTDTAPRLRDLPPRLVRPQGLFVTLKKRGELRGCIGRVTSEEPLALLVSRMAFEAAFKDPRFSPLAPDELAALTIEISLLTRPAPVPRAADVVMGRDGVILHKGGRGAVFLPQVATETGWGREQFLDQLCRKASMSTGCWREGATLLTFQAEVFKE
jgi:MEMO1 family protein